MSNFRDLFTQTLERQIARLPVCGASRPSVDIAQILEALECVVGLPLSPTESQALLAAISNTLAWDTGFPYQVGWDIVQTAWFTALGQPENIAPKAVLFGLEYMQMVNSLRPAIGGKNKLIQIYVSDNGDSGKITAFANNGYSIIRHECKCYTQGKPFAGHIGVPAHAPGKLELVTLSPTSDATVVEYGDWLETYTSPVYSQDCQGIWTKLMVSAEAPRSEVLFNPTFLRDMASGMRAGTLTPQPVRISIGIEDGPISVECGPTQAIFMPLANRERAS